MAGVAQRGHVPERGGEALRIEGLHKSFGSLAVLRGIDLVVDEHEVVCLIGASGSGKSTLLRCVNKLEASTGGHIFFEDIEVTSPSTDINEVRKRIGMVFQKPNPFPAMSIRENVLAGLRLTLPYDNISRQIHAAAGKGGRVEVFPWADYALIPGEPIRVTEKGWGRFGLLTGEAAVEPHHRCDNSEREDQAANEQD